MIIPQDIEEVRYGISFWLKRWYRNPLAYVIECVGDIPTHQQAQILKAFEHHNFVAVKSGHGIGKSKLTGWLVNWWLDTRGKRAPITGAGGDQLYDVVWPEVIQTKDRKLKWLSDQYEDLTGELRQKFCKSLARAVLRVVRMDNNDALQGFHDCMFFIDEGSGVRDEIFEVASGAMGDPGAFGFMDGNPTRLSGYMWRVFHEPTFWFTMSFSSEDSLSDEEYSYSYVDPLGEIRILHVRGRQTRDWILNMRKQYGLTSNVYRVRVLGEFSTLGKDLVIDERSLSRVTYSNEIPQKKGVRRMGIDPAWTGDDDTAVVIREDTKILYVESWHGFDTVDSFNRAKRIFDEWDCDVVHVDTIGVGAGIYDNFLHSVWEKRGVLGYPAIKVHASETAPADLDGACAKLRDWLWWKSRRFFRTKQVTFCGLSDDEGFEQLKKELSAPSYRILSNGSIKVEGKDEMKKRGVPSPNMADALNTTFFGDPDLFRENYVSNAEIRSRFGKKKKKTGVGWKGL